MSIEIPAAEKFRQTVDDIAGRLLRAADGHHVQLAHFLNEANARRLSDRECGVLDHSAAELVGMIESLSRLVTEFTHPGSPDRPGSVVLP